jgi:flavin-dependent dehydrogenase
MTGTHAGHDHPAVIVIGGGPAGASSARLLSLWGHRVLLVTRPTRRPPIAESLPPSCRKLLDPLGVTAAVEAAPFVRTSGNTVWWGDAGVRRHTFGGGERGYQVTRELFDRLLLDAAGEAGVEIESGAAVRGVTAPGGEPVELAAVRFDAGGQTGTRFARWVIDASGRSGVVARHGWRRPAPGHRTLALVAAWERKGGWGLEDETHTLVESYRDGWAWSVPVSSAIRHVAVMVDPARTVVARRGDARRPARKYAAEPGPSRSSLATVYAEELGNTRQLRALVSGATPCGGPWATDASSYDAERTAGRGIVLAGDAATFVDPLSSYGVKKALASGWLAAVVVNTCLHEPSLEGEALSFHETRERVMYDSLTQQSAELAREAGIAHDHPFWQDRASPGAAGQAGDPDIAALRGDPDVVGAFEAIRRAPVLRLRPTRGLRRVEKPVVRGNRIALQPHLEAPAFPDGIRYLRGVDLVAIVELAGGFEQVPDLYEAYQRTAAPVAMPDFLGALSVLLGKGLVERA